jgi:hypothetical protein
MRTHAALLLPVLLAGAAACGARPGIATPDSPPVIVPDRPTPPRPAPTQPETPGAPAAEPAAPGTLPAAQEEFWGRLQTLCGQAFRGALALGSAATDTMFAGRELVMHVRRCAPHRIEIPFHAGENRSRTWIVTRTATGLRLKHDHRHADGTEEEITQYGGDTQQAGTPQAQEFHADDHTAALVPAARTNIWTMEVLPGHHFAYMLRREGTDRRLRVEFDLSRPVEPPPAPWGH